MSTDELLENQPSRFVVGIDLGTTNSAVCYVDTHERPWRVRVLEIPQLVAPGQVEARDTLPSFHYQQPQQGPKSKVQGPRSDSALAWKLDLENSDRIVGFMARDYGSATPGRLIASAKSWLCHTGVDRTAELLPWHAASDVERISPVEASSRYLAHIHTAWNERFPAEPLNRQDIVLTLPASFDEIARELTVEAAARAGLARIVLIEEPQAAYYAWIYKHQDNWDQIVSPGQKILVCDIGGGTTDFTLIRVRRADPHPGTLPKGEGEGKVQFHRVAVGDHLILGGDNMDLALAQHLEAKLTTASGVRQHPDSVAQTHSPDAHREADASRSPQTGNLEPRQWDVLLRVSRQVKEQMLSDSAPNKVTVNVPGSGAKLIGGSLQTEVTSDDVRQVLVEGFMPRVPLTARPAARRSGFQEFGLPYAADPAITRHLAAFVTAHRFAGEKGSGSGAEGSGFGVQGSGKTDVDPARPDVVLFNGGVFDSPILRQRLLDCLDDWFGNSLAPSPSPPALHVLDNDRLDLAVARGAAYYGMVRRGEGVKIVASLARSYYIGIDSPWQQSESHPPEPRTLNPEPLHALCLVPGSAEPGQEIEMPGRQFDLVVSEPVEFPLYTSSVRLTDQAGVLVPFDPEQMTALPPIRTALKTRTRRERGTVPVHLHAKLTEIGTLELWCREVGGERTWRLAFDVRSATQSDVVAHQSAAESQGFVDEATAEACREVLASVFAGGSEKPDSINARLEAAVGSERHEWPTSLLRRLWEVLIEMEAGRRRSPQHEARWLNLLGYALRPGYGLAVDDWRVAETWKTVQGKLVHAAPTSRTEALILWRRIAGGLTVGQQRALAEPLLATVRSLHSQTRGATSWLLSPHESLEVLRLLGSLELLPVEVKIELGRTLLDLLPRKKLDSVRPTIAWSIGRLGARQPAYGPLNAVVPPDEASDWVSRLLKSDAPDAMASFAVVNLARRTGDRYRDLPDDQRHAVVSWLTDRRASEHAIKLVREGDELAADEQDKIFGEALPKGLRLR